MATPSVEASELQFESSWEDVFRFYEDYASVGERHFDAKPDGLPNFIARVENDAWQDYRNWPQIKTFIETAVNFGFNRTLRAGTSLFSFVVSRSIEHGMRAEQPRIAIFFAHNRIAGTHNLDGDIKEFTTEIKFDDTIHELFRRLEQRPLT